VIKINYTPQLNNDHKLIAALVIWHQFNLLRGYMTLFNNERMPPTWCELRAFDIVDFKAGDTVRHSRRQTKERLLVTSGTVQFQSDDGSIVLKENQFIDPINVEWTIVGCSMTAQLVRLSGIWGTEVSGCGIFRVTNQDNPKDVGDPVSYPKTTGVDSHYHDCDEYWIVLEGECEVVVGTLNLPMSPGDCLAIGIGHHHDMPRVHTPVKAVFFETTLERGKRIGHLWNHTHGLAMPAPERM
jgi:hypothetical protein